tara:strand:+ start:8020 stop:9072 length:1053 start_codon:yes stop_codon:yes gene_type:complete
MTIKASGSSLSFTEIAAEFGNPLNNKLGNYRVTFDNTDDGGSFSNLPLDAGIPQSGQIKFSDFYSKQLNIVVKGYGGGAESWASKNAAAVYDNNQVEVIGNPGKTRPQRNATEWQGGKTVKINVNKVIGSSLPGSQKRRRCALKTGSWPSGTNLSVDVGGEGIITGTGGDGGNGGTGKGGGAPGENASSALGIQYSPINVNVSAGGIIQNGYGGGGGGGGAVRDPNKEGEDNYYGGGGGGGGAGYPHSSGGTGGVTKSSGSPGGGGSTQLAGGGGGASSGGGGGQGGDREQAAAKGSPGSGSGPVGGSGGGGNPGNNGDAIRATMSQSGNVFISNSGSIRGSQSYSVPVS